MSFGYSLREAMSRCGRCEGLGPIGSTPARAFLSVRELEVYVPWTPALNRMYAGASQLLEAEPDIVVFGFMFPQLEGVQSASQPNPVSL